MRAGATAIGLIVAAALLYGCAAPAWFGPPLFGTGRACFTPEGFAAAADANSASLLTLSWSPFGRPEQGWAPYALRASREIRTYCPPQSPGFARRLALWQASAGLPSSGVVDDQTLLAMKSHWQAARPFLAQRASGVCPDPPPEADLTTLPSNDVYPGKTILMRRGAARALHRMLSAARTDVEAAAQGPKRLVAFSGYRSPAYDDARCAKAGDCDGVGRAACSVHRTGLAVDLVMGSVPGYGVDSSADVNRRYQTSTPVYRWLVDNAGRFGFVNYAYEPWHWEWTGHTP